MGSAPAWDNYVVPFDQLLNITGPLVATPANQLLQHLAQLSLETPIVMGAVLHNDPNNITILNIPRSYPRGVVAQANLDGNIYGFVECYAWIPVIVSQLKVGSVLGPDRGWTHLVGGWSIETDTA